MSALQKRSETWDRKMDVTKSERYYVQTVCSDRHFKFAVETINWVKPEAEKQFKKKKKKTTHTGIKCGIKVKGARLAY